MRNATVLATLAENNFFWGGAIARVRSRSPADDQQLYYGRPLGLALMGALVF